MDKSPIKPSMPSSGAAGRAYGRTGRDLADIYEEKLPPPSEDVVVKVLHKIIHYAVKFLAVLMTGVILWSVIDVVSVIYQHAVARPFLLLGITDLLAIFGAFLTVLIAIEIFVNITLYIKHDVLPLKMVIATALMAISRKVIMLDLKETEPLYILAISAVIAALGLTYWLISYKPVLAKPIQDR
ncbi:MAG: phosphate-starvation-inducible PsiE family protein [Methylomonas sp.]|jgi:uncharacterized membrane protein (DUF373 family)